MAQRSEGIDVQTLALTAVASATAAYVTSKVWAAGTLASAAMTPVIVALIREGLRKPTEVVTSAVVVPGRGRTRRTVAAPAGDPATARYEQGAPPPLPPPEPGAAAGPVRIYSTRGRRLRWRLALLTGLLGFAACVALYTVPELIAGRSATHGGDRTTLFGGSRHGSARPAPTTTPTTTAPAPAQTAPAETVTVPAPGATETETETAPAAPAPPPATTTMPPEATPAPEAPAPPAQTTP
ncbi:hypothetical protein [Nitrosomonas communis]|uniref:hypothetical protein n=1 Tax=Nitrosomonas communis TaxID=44574 RepID=UPI003D2DC2A5